MISIVTAYYNRKKLFTTTLKSIKNQNFNGEFEVIAVDDGSDEIERLEDLVPKFPFLRVIRLEKENKWYKNSCIPFNIGFKEAKGDKIIIQNPECLHFDNILKYTEENLKKNNFISFACFSLDKYNTKRIEEIVADKNIFTTLTEHNNFRFKMDGELGWYNHSVHHPVFYHFCCCITKNDLFDLGGFDERYALGIGVDDNEFIYRIREKGMILKIEDNVTVLHQNHYSHNKNTNEMNLQKSVDYSQNMALFENVTKSNKHWRVNYLGEKPADDKSIQIIDDYKKLIDNRLYKILPNRFARKLTLALLVIIEKIKF